jgi:amidase
VQVDEQPLAAARRASEALADLGHEVDEGAPDWDDETFPSAWSTFVTGALQHLVCVVERLHGRPVDSQQLEPSTRGWILDSAPVTLIDYLEAREQLIAFSRRVMRSWPADSVLLTPTLTRLPAPVGGIRSRSGVTDDAVRFSALVRIWNVTGQPAISLPLHQTPDGIPVGVQLIAPPGREDLLIGLAAQLEQSVGWSPTTLALDNHNS